MSKIKREKVIDLDCMNCLIERERVVNEYAATLQTDLTYKEKIELIIYAIAIFLILIVYFYIMLKYNA